MRILGLVLLAVPRAVESLTTPPRCPRQRRVALSSSPFPFADVVEEASAPESTMDSSSPGFVQPSVQQQLADIDRKREATEAAIEAARTRAVEARLEALEVRSTIEKLKKGSPSASIDAASRTKAQAEEIKVQTAASKRRASALVRSRDADIAEAVRLVKTELAVARFESSAAAEDLATAKEVESKRVLEARAAAEKEIDAAKPIRVPGIERELRVKPVPAVLVAAFAGLLLSKAINLDKLDLIAAAVSAGAMLLALPPDERNILDNDEE